MTVQDAKANGSSKAFATQQSLNSAIKNVCDIMRRSNCAGALQLPRVPLPLAGLGRPARPEALRVANGRLRR